ncbi:MAG: ABC transporter permease subunit [Fimbriimonadaceae bacterium]
MRLRELFIENPLLIEFKRNLRRFFLVGRGKGANLGIFTMAILIYFFIFMIVFSVRTYLEISAIVVTQLVLLSFIVPAIMHGTIAGERERRSWDMLLVAPISNKQIVYGKFMSGAAMIGLMLVLFWPLILILFPYDVHAPFSVVLGQQLTVAGYGVFVAGLSIYISSRCNRAFSANLIIFGTVFILLVVLPIFLAMALSRGPDQSIVWFFHPFWTVLTMETSGASSSGGRDQLTAGYGIIQSLSYLAAAFALLSFAEASFRSIDQRVGSQ